MTDLLKEAIADAKAVREMAVKQARAALEESFAPTIDAIISKRLQTEEDEEEMEDEMEEAISPEPGVELGTDDEHEEAKENSGLTEEEELEEVADTSNIGTGDNKEPSADSSEESTEDEEGAGAQADWTDDAKENSGLTEDVEEDVDLNQIVKELEDEADEVEDEEDFDVDVDMEEEPAEDEEGYGHEAEESPEFEAGEEEEESEEEPEMEEEELELEIEDDVTDDEEEAPEGEEEEELDLESLMGEAEDDENAEDEMEVEGLRKENAALRKKLGESLKVVKFQKARLNEINVLNAKLLFTNKVFSEYNLDDSSKIKVIENFDRAKNVREIKLIFATLMENMKADKRNKVSSKAQRLVEGASKAMGSTKSKKEEQIVNEQDDIKDRVHKLINYKRK